MFETNEGNWARVTFGDAKLGHARRTRRLVEMASTLARNPEMSVSATHGDDEAGKEGAYRFIRNPHVDAMAIAEAGFAHTARQSRGYDGDIIAAEDTTTLSYRHEVSGLGDLGGPVDSRPSGLWVHSILLVTADSGIPLGLVDQAQWVRDPSERGKKHRRRNRPYEEKESFKWQAASERMATRLDAETMARVISVCDREADIHSYLAYKVREDQRFVVRATQARRIMGTSGKTSVLDELKAQPALGQSTVELPQRGGRSGRTKRTAVLTLRSTSVVMRPPSRRLEELEPLELNAVLVSEEDAPEGATPLCWALLTSEPVDDLAAAAQVVDLYRKRWRIEDFHKAWKTGGTNVEGLRLQTATNIKRLAIILAFIAVRLLQLREYKETKPDAAVTTTLAPIEWKILWARIEKTRPPSEPPTISWAYRAIARLGGWSDTKRTGRASWTTLWLGWNALRQLVEGYELAQTLNAVDM